MLKQSWQLRKRNWNEHWKTLENLVSLRRKLKGSSINYDNPKKRTWSELCWKNNWECAFSNIRKSIIFEAIIKTTFFLKISCLHLMTNFFRSVENLKRENNELLKRLEISEARNEELSESVTLATKPLLRQLEQLQSSFAVKTSSFSKQEKLMSEKIDELQAKLESLVTTDRSLVEENVCLKKKISSLESQIKRKDSEKNDVEETLKKLRLQNEKLEQENSWWAICTFYFWSPRKLLCKKLSRI